MSAPNRRDFLKDSSKSIAALSVAAAAVPAMGQEKDRLNVAVIGCGGMGSNHLNQLVRRKDVRVAYVCDPDEERLARAAKTVESNTGQAAKPVKDMRTIFDDQTVSAVWIATPDHWHGPATILACNAGKHVYVEKPCSHNIREGRLMIEAARKNKVVVQVGMQSRSTKHVQEAIQRLRDGAIGDILVAKAWNSQRRANIGHAEPSDPPKTIDYDLWVGPAPFVPYKRNRLHYTWHWYFHFGTGDMGNDGVHDIDVARWGLGVDGLPNRVAGLGGKRFFDDDQEFPDTQYVVFEFGEGGPGQVKQLIYEHRIWSPYRQEGFENGDAFYGTKGMLLLGKNDGWKLYGERNKLIEERKGSTDVVANHQNFLDCIRSGERPNADIEIGHHSAVLCHLGNIACRMGRGFEVDPEQETIVNDKDAAALVGREYRDQHWAIPQG